MPIPEVEEIGNEVDKDCYILVDLEKNEYVSLFGESTSDILYAMRRDSLEDAKKAACRYCNEHWHNIPLKIIKCNYKMSELITKLKEVTVI